MHKKKSMAKTDITIGGMFFKLAIFSPPVWFIFSSLSFWLACPPSFWRGQNLSAPKEAFPTSGNDNLIHQPFEQGSIY
jgi:hypothetical protein